MNPVRINPIVIELTDEAGTHVRYTFHDPDPELVGDLLNVTSRAEQRGCLHRTEEITDWFPPE